MIVSDLYRISCNNSVGGDRFMKTVLGCETCIYGYLAIDGAGYYCSQPEHKKIECVKNKLTAHVAQLKTNKPSNASSVPTVICDFGAAEGQQEVKQNDNIGIVDNVLQQIKVGRVYRHFKGKLYLVLDLSQHSETGEQYVVYKALYGDCKTYVRPYQMFASGVDREKYPDVEQEFRFQLVED